MPSPSSSVPFLFVTCQVGAERALKSEISRRWPEFRAAFARPGFLTFKLPADLTLAPDFDLESIFARSYGFSLGKVALPKPASDDSPADTVIVEAVADDVIAAAAAEVWKLVGDLPATRIHVWQRDRCESGERGFEPSLTPLSATVYAALAETCPHSERLSPGDHLLEPAGRDETVVDCILVEPDQWIVGFHKTHSVPSRWPGGLMTFNPPAELVSRAWFKIEEALAWSQLPIKPGARCAEIGSAPGGSVQSLLARGLHVVGIDPAVMDERVASHASFQNIRRRAMQVPRRAFRKIRWLTADMNVAPSFTLDVVEEIVRSPEINIRGMLLTLKLPDWSLASELPTYLERIKSWGYNEVHARQLQYNHREVCVSALMRPFVRKPAVAKRRAMK